MNDAHDIAMYLRAAYLAMHRFTNSCFVDIGVTADQYVLLSVLSEGRALTQKELARRFFSDQNTIRPMLAILERLGLISRNLHPRDGRARTVELTEKGIKALEQFNLASDPVRDRIYAAFKPAELQTVLNCLGRIAEAMDLPISVEKGVIGAAADDKKSPKRKQAT
jgi:DNA-binding MarR family transcriptional regulator